MGKRIRINDGIWGPVTIPPSTFDEMALALERASNVAYCENHLSANFDRHMSDVLEGLSKEIGTVASKRQQSTILIVCETADPEISSETRQRMLGYLRAHSEFRIAAVNGDSEKYQDLAAAMHSFASDHQFAINDIAMFLIVNGGSG